MEIEFKGNEIRFSRELSKLDNFVLSFGDALSKNKIKYVIVSGYIAILFGRSRISEDVDFLIECIPFEKFLKFWAEIELKYKCLNTSGKGYLEKNLAIRMAKKGSFIPNAEIKFVKSDLDRYSLEHRKHVKLGSGSLFISPLELQIPYKLFLGSEKDIEDARFLYRLFKENLDAGVLTKFLIKLKIPSKNIEKYLGAVNES